jgi:hypothetical protein
VRRKIGVVQKYPRALSRSIGWGALFFLWTLSAASQPLPKRSVSVCAKSESEARERWQSGSLRDALELYQSCTPASCGERARRCRAAVARLEQDLPTVIPVVLDPSGAPLVDVQVALDGQPFTSRIDGRGLPVDPGVHQFSFSTSGKVFHSEKVLIIEGQRNRLLSVRWADASVSPIVASPPSEAPAAVGSAAPLAEPRSLAPSSALPPVTDASAPISGDRESPAPSALTYVVAGTGLAAIGTSLLLVYWGSNDNEKLNRCAPDCNPDSVRHIRRMYIASDITMGAGVAALGVATWLLVSDLTEDHAAPASAYSIDVKPLRSGAFAAFGGAF